MAVRENKNQMKIDLLQEEVREMRSRDAERRGLLVALQDLDEGLFDISPSDLQPTGNEQRDRIAKAALDFLEFTNDFV